MSLSARVTLEPSLSVARLETLVAVAGVVAAAWAVALRWPACGVLAAATAAGMATAVVIVDVRRWRRARAMTFVLSDRDAIGVFGEDDDRRLDPSTVVWPWLAVLAVVPVCGGAVRRRVAPSFELPADDRRALARFLVWSLDRARGAGRSAGRR